MAINVSIEVERRAIKRRAALGIFSHMVGDRDIDIAAIKADDRLDVRSSRTRSTPIRRS